MITFNSHTVYYYTPNIKFICMNVLMCLSSDYSFEYAQTLVSSDIKKNSRASTC